MRNRENYSDEEWHTLCQQDAECIAKLTKHLKESGHGLCTEQELIDKIKNEHIDISSFKLPYDSKDLQDWQNAVNERNAFLEANKKEFQKTETINRWL